MTAAATAAKRIGTDAIPVRQMDFEFDEAISTFWFDGDPLRTMILTALSGTFPEGERMFMRSVRHYQSNLKDPELRQRVKAFIGQEAHHGKEHQTFNDMMTRKGIPVDKIDAYTKMGLKRIERFYSPGRVLAKTCALEHFTALFAELLLAHPELIDGVDEPLKPLWIWHAIEESEHKSVAYDVYQEQVGGYWLRVSEMAITTVMFSFFSALHTAQLLQAAKDQPRTRRWRLKDRVQGMWRHREVLAELGKHYLTYYKPDFHPSQKDSRALRDRGLALLTAYVGDKAHISA
ncbi:metal-dependent hydrolase [Ketobacter sp.]|uniref:metal-dependent hydrolase n=1 Tax=Ketobacter sp. TaxID=2083498 RepID=UPI000F1DC1D2|nr:metal-dependent hydrolase [Ketobacter sp.]RLU00638.1 MAG: metal-dependent hydrolase [Ketobacter sp.]